MPQKPRRRKRSGARTGYLVAGIVVVIVAAAVGWYTFGSTKGPQSTGLECPNPPSSVTSNLIYARIETSKGSVEVELFPTAAPQTAANFVNLSKSGFYDNLVWHRIVDTPTPFVIQTGDPLTRNGGGDRSLWGTGGSGKSVPLEVYPSLHNYVCYLGMARGQSTDSGSSQFYINLGNNTALDGSYTVFGRVVSGMDVVNEIASVPVNSNSQPVDPVFVTAITILSSGP